jgi:prolyl-tRNA synthetase
VGPRDLAAGNVVLARRFDGSKRPVSTDEVVSTVLDTLETDQRALFDQAKAHMDENTRDVSTLDDAIAASAEGFARVPWSKVKAAGEAKANEVGVTVRCLVRKDGSVPESEEEKGLVAYLAKAY